VNKTLYIPFAAVLVGLSACSSTPSCLKSQPYTDAQQFPGLKSPPGLDVPAPDPDMQIPNVSDGPIAAYATAPAGTDPEIENSRCLTTPPPISDNSGA